ncbi:MAG TPA: DUF885 domain-containing protein [Holophagaceae bacterium]|nr:DUF885 domain-containing protein [Holophagaceae bacterium]
MTFRIAAALASGAALMASAPSPANAKLDALMKDYWEYSLRTSPESATAVGDPRYNDRLTDYSLAGIRKDLAAQKGFLAKAKAFKASALDADHQLDRELLMWQIQTGLDGARFKPWEMPLNQMSGLHVDFPALFSLHPFNTEKDFQDYLARLHAFPKAMDDTLANMRAGLKDGIMPPRLIADDLVAQVKAMASGDTARAPFLAPLDKLPAGMSDDQKAKFKAEVARAIDQEVTPAYGRLLAFLEKDYAPKALPEPGAWALPDGAARYAYAVKAQTTTNLTPAQIHEIGLKEVARIEGEMLAIAKGLGYADLASFRAALAKDPSIHPKDAAQLVARYKGFVDGMRPELPKLFGRLPKAQLVVVPMEAFREKDAAAADYNAGTPDGSRPGRFNVNTYEAPQRSMLTCESTAYHEAIPGHHLQISIAQELERVPDFRKVMGVTAYQEGWALYSESLGKDIGFYKDPYSDYGRLTDEMLRAIRLVVDTGVHSMRWSRQQMVDYFHAHSGNDEVEIQAETDRYIAWPGQAQAYNIGQLTFLRLREKAKAELGARFDIRAFHDEVLDSGALPMDVLERRVDAWIAEQKK